MVNCPRCEQPVDETVRTTCPLCFTPLQPEANMLQSQPGIAPDSSAPASSYGSAPAQPGAAPHYQTAIPLAGAPVQPSSAMPLNSPSASASRAANTRMTLNGDIIDTPQSAQAAAPGGGAYANRPAAPRPSYGLRTRVEPQKRSAGSTVAIVLALLLLLGGGGYGGYYWWMHRTNPKDTVQQFLTAVKAQDWKTVYELSDHDDPSMSKYTSAQDFADKTKADLDKVPGGGQFLNGLLSNMKFTVQDVKDNDGSTATVPVKITMNFLGQDIDQTKDMKMKNVGGSWKVPTSGNSLGMPGGMGMSGGGTGGGRMGGGFGGR